MRHIHVCHADVGAAHIAGLHSLTWLSLAQNCRLSDAGLRRLASGLPLLESLNLNHTMITTNSIMEVMRLPVSG